MSGMIAGHREAAYPEPANHFVARLLADLLHLIGSGIVGSMPLSRTQQQTADLFQAAGAQESCRTRTPPRLTSGQQAAEELSSRHVLPRDLSNALKQLDDGELNQLLEATRDELQRRGRSLTSTPVIRPTTQMSTEQRASDQSTTAEKSHGLVIHSVTSDCGRLVEPLGQVHRRGSRVRHVVVR